MTTDNNTGPPSAEVKASIPTSPSSPSLSPSAPSSSSPSSSPSVPSSSSSTPLDPKEALQAYMQAELGKTAKVIEDLKTRIDDYTEELSKKVKSLNQQLDKKIKQATDEFKEQIESGKTAALQMLGFFVALFTFVSVNITLFSKVQYLSVGLLFMILMAVVLIVFVIALNLIINPGKMPGWKMSIHWLAIIILFFLAISSVIFLTIRADERFNLLINEPPVQNEVLNKHPTDLSVKKPVSDDISISTNSTIADKPNLPCSTTVKEGNTIETPIKNK